MSTLRSVHRPLTALLLAASSALLLAGCGGSSRTASLGASDRAPVGLESIIRPGDDVRLTVWGMSCPKCITNVDQILSDLDGVHDVHTDMANGLVTLRAGSPAPVPAAIHDAITRAGFTLMEIQVEAAGS